MHIARCIVAIFLVLAAAIPAEAATTNEALTTAVFREGYVPRPGKPFERFANRSWSGEKQSVSLFQFQPKVRSDSYNRRPRHTLEGGAKFTILSLSEPTSFGK